VNRASADALDVTFNRETINPRLTNLREQMEADLLGEWETAKPTKAGTWYCVRFDNPVPEDRDFELKETTDLFRAGLMEFDEARQRHQLTAWETELGEAVVLPAGYTPTSPETPLADLTLSGGGLFGDGGTGTPPPPGDTGDEGQPAAEPQVEQKSIQRSALARMPWHENAALRLSMWREAERSRQSWERLCRAALLRVYKGQATRVFRVINEQWTHGTPTVAHVVHAVGAMFGARGEREVLNAVANVIARVFKTEGEAALKLALKLNPQRAKKKKPNPMSPKYSWQAAAKHHLAIRDNLIRGVSDTRFKRIVSVIRDAMTTTDYDGGSATVGRKLREFFDYDDARALLVARTEMGSAANAAALDGYRAGGADAKGWLAQQDDRTRDSHAEIDGEVVPIEASFSNGLDAPGDPAGPPEQVCNCRCTVTPEFLQNQ
jgi:SPP1 gp7 family putative phage head morphogenesis protein